MATNYGKNREFIQKLIDDYNKTSSLKVPKEEIIKSLDNSYREINKIEPDVIDNNYKDKCFDKFKHHFKTTFDQLADSFDKQIREGKRDIGENNLKKYNNDFSNLKGMLYSIFSLSFLDHLDNKKELQDKGKNYIHDRTWKARDRYDFDGNEFDLYSSTLNYTEKEIKQASNYSIKNLSSYVDYKANKIRNNTWHIDSISDELKDSLEKIDNTCKREDLTDLIYKYKALEEKHNNRSFLSRIFHSSESKQLADAKEKFEYLMQNNVGLGLSANKNESMEHWMARNTDPSYVFGYIQGGIIDDNGIKEYENKIDKYQKGEVQEEKIESIEVSDNELENENDLDKSFYIESTHTKGLETAMEERINEIADDLKKDL